MKIKERMKRFRTLNRHHADGFTLVELIVVIAILAILGGVAVPVYSGYVEKTNEAADQQLLAAVNTAFAAACAENGTDTYNVPEQPELKLTADKAVNEVMPYDTEFEKYFAGNEDAKFKTDNAIVFDILRGAFVLMLDGETVSLRYGDNGYIVLSAKDISNFMDSTFNTAEGLGIESLLGKVNLVANVASGLNNSESYNKVLNDPDYQRSFLEYLGYNTEGKSDDWVFDMYYDEARPQLVQQKLNQLIAENNLDWNNLSAEEKSTWSSKATNQVEANMSVLHAAQNTTSLTKEQINGLLTSSDPKGVIIGALSDPGQGLAEAALYYGMYTSFAHSEYATDKSKGYADKPYEFITSLGEDKAELEAFQKYVNTDQYKNDLDAYLSSMNMINSSTGNPDAINDVLVNGFNDPELIKLLQQATGSK